MGRSQVCVAFLSLLLSAACATGTEGLVAGQQYEGFIRGGTSQVQVALPEGKWTLVGWSIYPNEQELGGVVIQTEGNVVSHLVDFYLPWRTETRMYLQPYKFCGRNDILYVGKAEVFVVYQANKMQPQDCWGINHWPMTLSGNVPKHLLAVRDYLEENDLVMPSTMIAVQYRRGGRGKYLSVNYYFNPELEGLPPPAQVEWRTSDWHRDRAFRDPAKKAYIEKLIEWGENWHEQVDWGFKGQLERGHP